MSDEDLFAEQDALADAPLAARIRPQSLDGFFGQQHILGPGKPLREAIQNNSVHSLILWGPPGVGKTTLARLIAKASDAEFIALSAVLSGVKEIRSAIEQARFNQLQKTRKTILFVDEVHRFNKSQQDAFLPHIEDGTIIFIGATTENPSFELNNALLSRTRMYVLKTLSEADLLQIAEYALADEAKGFGRLDVVVEEGGLALLVAAADGDARRLLNWLELLVQLQLADDDSCRISKQHIEQIIQGDIRRFDKAGDIFYEQISALHKAVRGSSPDAALYWFVRMLDGGCDPLYIARRVIRMASEDIGNADPRALQLALAAWDVQTRLGSPEGELSLAQVVIYMACAPKSNAVYEAFNAVRDVVRNQPGYDVPLHLRNASTSLLKDLDYGSSYRYAHDEPEAYAAGESYLPEALSDMRWYQPVERGLEGKIAEKLRYLASLDRASKRQRYGDAESSGKAGQTDED